MKVNEYISLLAAFLLFIFGAATVFMGGSVLFDLFDMRAKQGNYIPFVVLANWICGFIYLLAAYGLIARKQWTKNLLFVALVLLIATFLGFAYHIFSGGLYEMKTLGAMTFRTLLTLIMLIVAHLIIPVRKEL
ncbi:MAG: hypothetical protein IT263_08160 [Saprospiraceae bacterium]|nr:hypothetical protein [Saprospiraceae bacterium]